MADFGRGKREMKTAEQRRYWITQIQWDLEQIAWHLKRIIFQFRELGRDIWRVIK